MTTTTNEPAGVEHVWQCDQCKARQTEPDDMSLLTPPPPPACRQCGERWFHRIGLAAKAGVEHTIRELDELISAGPHLGTTVVQEHSAGWETSDPIVRAIWAVAASRVTEEELPEEAHRLWMDPGDSEQLILAVVARLEGTEPDDPAAPGQDLWWGDTLAVVPLAGEAWRR